MSPLLDLALFLGFYGGGAALLYFFLKWLAQRLRHGPLFANTFRNWFWLAVSAGAVFALICWLCIASFMAEGLRKSPQRQPAAPRKPFFGRLLFPR
jgi:hypothetical protein